MDKRTVKHKDERGLVEYTIYTKKEADELGLEYKDWKECVNGENGVTDDGFVGVCIRVWENRYKGGKVVFTAKTFPMGTGVVFTTGKIHRLDYLNRARPDIYYFGNKGTPDYRMGLTAKESEMFAKIYALTMDSFWSYKFVRPWVNDKRAKFWGKVFMETKPGRKIVAKEVTQMLDDMGYDDENVMNLLMEGLDMARTKKDCGNFNRAVETLIKLRGLEKKPISEKHVLTLNADLSKLIASENQKLQEVTVAEEIVDGDEVCNGGAEPTQ